MNANSYYQKFIIKDEHNSTLALLYIVNNPALCRLIVPFCKLNNKKLLKSLREKKKMLIHVTYVFSFTPNIFYPFKFLSFNQFFPFPNLMIEKKKVKPTEIIEGKEKNADLCTHNQYFFLYPQYFLP